MERCCSEIDEATVENGGRKPHGKVADMMKDLKDISPWITMHVTNFAYDKHTRRIVKKDKVHVKEKEVTKIPKKVVGRSIGMANIVKYEMKVRKQKRLDAALVLYAIEINTAKKLGRNIKKGTLEKIIRAQKEKFSIWDDIKIDREAIHSRFHRGNWTSKHVGPDSPMTDVEPKLVELIIRIGKIRRCLAPIQYPSIGK